MAIANSGSSAARLVAASTTVRRTCESTRSSSPALRGPPPSVRASSWVPSPGGWEAQYPRRRLSATYVSAEAGGRRRTAIQARPRPAPEAERSRIPGRPQGERSRAGRDGSPTGPIDTWPPARRNERAAERAGTSWVQQLDRQAAAIEPRPAAPPPVGSRPAASGSAERPFPCAPTPGVASMAMDAPQIPIDPVDPREALVAERSRVLEQLKEIAVEAPGQMTYGSQAAAASHVFEQQRDLALRDHDQQHLGGDRCRARAPRRRHLRRVHVVRSGRSPTDRLEALPWAALCIDCQRATPPAMTAERPASRRSSSSPRSAPPRRSCAASPSARRSSRSDARSAAWLKAESRSSPSARSSSAARTTRPRR